VSLRKLSPWRFRQLPEITHSGVHSDGGYAEMMIAQANWARAIPDDLL